LAVLSLRLTESQICGCLREPSFGAHISRTNLADNCKLPW
jgi:hypothetical protein